MKKPESDFQAMLIMEIKTMFPGCIVLKNDEQYIQGFPDLTILCDNFWFVLECKRSYNEPYRPNQEYYLDKTNRMSYSATIYPENKEDILNEIQSAYFTGRTTRFSRSK